MWVTPRHGYPNLLRPSRNLRLRLVRYLEISREGMSLSDLVAEWIRRRDWKLLAHFGLHTA